MRTSGAVGRRSRKDPPAPPDAAARRAASPEGKTPLNGTRTTYTFQPPAIVKMRFRVLINFYRQRIAPLRQLCSMLGTTNRSILAG